MILGFLKIFFVFRKKNLFPKIIFLSLTKDQVIRGGKVDDFVSFISEDRFGFVLNNQLSLVEIRHFLPLGRKFHGNEIKITRDVYFYLILHHLKLRDYFKLYTKVHQYINEAIPQLLNFKYYKKNIFDYAAWCLLNELQVRQLFLVTTQSQLLNLPKVFEFKSTQLQKIMMWYSTNSIPIIKIGEIYSRNWLNAKVKDCIDVHYVWNYEQALSLKEQGVNNCKIVGSILFYPSRSRSTINKYITYFDVTPYINADTIYTEKYCVGILLIIMEVIKDLNNKYQEDFILRIKPKRSYSRSHSKRYIEFLRQLSADKKVEVTYAHENLYECISESKAILAVPFSSPIEIGEEIGVPGAYFTEGSAEWDLKPRNKSIPLLSGKRDLENWLERIFCDS